MLKPGAKRFYKTASATTAAPFAVRLDDRPMRTPGGKPQIVPTQALAEAMAAEWETQGEHLDLASMVLTKAVNTAIDRIEPRRTEVVDELSRFAGSDLLCYRATAPRELVERQVHMWDPWLDWARREFDIALCAASGIVHVEQPPESIEATRRAIAQFDSYALTAIHPAITISGSAILGLAFGRGQIGPLELLTLSRVDEDYQAERWGEDAEAAGVRQNRLNDLLLAARMLDLLRA
ncbi:MAG: ATP12 family chaperone protein [Alphaproteobacteria bacterium]